MTTIHTIINREINKFKAGYSKTNIEDIASECFIKCLEISKKQGWEINDPSRIPYITTTVQNHIKKMSFDMTHDIGCGYQKYVLIQKIKERLEKNIDEETIKIELRLSDGRFNKLKQLVNVPFLKQQNVDLESIVYDDIRYLDFSDSLSPTENKIANLILQKYTREEIKNKTQIGFRKLNRIYRRIGRKILNDMQ